MGLAFWRVKHEEQARLAREAGAAVVSGEPRSPLEALGKAMQRPEPKVEAPAPSPAAKPVEAEKVPDLKLAEEKHRQVVASARSRSRLAGSQSVKQG